MAGDRKPLTLKMKFNDFEIITRSRSVPVAVSSRSDLERLYARLEDEYEVKERANALQHKLQVIEGTSRALIDIIDTERSSRLEATIVLLIVVEVLIAFYDLFFRIAK